MLTLGISTPGRVGLLHLDGGELVHSGLKVEAGGRHVVHSPAGEVQGVAELHGAAPVDCGMEADLEAAGGLP